MRQIKSEAGRQTGRGHGQRQAGTVLPRKSPGSGRHGSKENATECKRLENKTELPEPKTQKHESEDSQEKQKALK